jgi:hypothetical protein
VQEHVGDEHEQAFGITASLAEQRVRPHQ